MGCQQTKIRELSDEDIDFLKTHTKYDEQTIREWYEGFKVDCPTGQLSRKKFIDIYRTFFPTGNPEKFCDHVFRTFDTDNSGRIDFKEFLMAIGITASNSGEERLKWAFRMYDINNDGGIELDEMTKIVKALYDMLGPGTYEESPEERTKEIFLKMDKDGDGTLSIKEFVDGCLLDKKLAALLTANNGAG